MDGSAGDERCFHLENADPILQAAQDLQEPVLSKAARDCMEAPLRQHAGHMTAETPLAREGVGGSEVHSDPGSAVVVLHLVSMLKDCVLEQVRAYLRSWNIAVAADAE